MVKVSIVIPVYNMERYLDKCMESVLAQTLSEIEIILVDDGSLDTSPSLCDAYAKKDSRIKVIHKENGGLTSAWKAGSLASTGEYIGYIDSDDFIEKEMFQVLYERAKKTDADIVCCGLRHIYEDEPERSWTEQMDFKKDSLTEKDLKEEFFAGLINDGSFLGRHLMPNRVTKLTRAELVKKKMDSCSDAVSIGEDFQFSLAMLLDAKRVEIVKDYFPYFYYMNGASMTMKHDRDYPEKIKIMCDNLCRIVNEKAESDLAFQIYNDFLCLTVLHIKAIVYKQKDKPYAEIKQEMKEVLKREEVQYAMKSHSMDKLSLSEKVFLFFMKKNMCLLLYLAVRIYFR